MRYLILLAALFISFGAAGKDLSTLDNNQLCVKFSSRHADKYLAEIDRRELLRPTYRDSVLHGGIRLGMTAIEVLCSWGSPHHRNDTHTAQGRSSQWVYSSYLGAAYGVSYVYIRNDRVTAIQD
jgi:hypothetical protein